MQEAAGAASATTNGTAALKGSSKAAASDADTQVHLTTTKAKQVSCGRPYTDSHLRQRATISATCSGAVTVCCSCNSAVAATAGSPLDQAQLLVCRKSWFRHQWLGQRQTCRGSWVAVKSFLHKSQHSGTDMLSCACANGRQRHGGASGAGGGVHPRLNIQVLTCFPVHVQAAGSAAAKPAMQLVGRWSRFFSRALRFTCSTSFLTYVCRRQAARRRSQRGWGKSHPF